MTEPAVHACGLSKSYGTTTVLDGLDLHVASGSIFALLGQNGAGKTTTVRILSTLLEPDAGRAAVCGHDVVADRHRVRRLVSLTGQYAAVDEALTGRENLRMIGRLAGLGRHAARARADQLLERFDLVDAAGRRAGRYSGGMRRRLDLAAGLLGDPRVLFLDEPSTGLDPRGRQALWGMVAALAADGVTVLLTTQYLEEADRLADRIGVIDGGRLVAEGSPNELKARVGAARLDLVAHGADSFSTLVSRAGAHATASDSQTRTVSVATDGSAAAVRTVLDRLDPARDLLASFGVHTATLDDAFLRLTGAGPRHASFGGTGSPAGEQTTDQLLTTEASCV